LILAPRVLGLRNPPPTIAEFSVDDHTILETTVLGGVFMAIPGVLFTRDGYRYDESNPPWAGDERICDWHCARGGRCGYVEQFAVDHIDTTDGQLERYPDYFARRATEARLWEAHDPRIRWKNAVKRTLLHVPFLERLNEKHHWFYPPGSDWFAKKPPESHNRP
jgi:hypothetical protein